jgi:hypothetical protein
MTELPNDPAAVVQRQLDAYNAHDLEALMATFAEDVAAFEHPNTLLFRGIQYMRERLRLRLQEPNLHAQLLNRIVVGNTVFDHEKITRTFPEGPGMLETVVIYEVQNGKIAKSWLLIGTKTLDPL